MMRGAFNRIALFAAAALLCAQLPAFNGAAEAGQPVVLEVSDELLQDGIDALNDDRPDLARQIFRNLLSSHPRSPAARKAAAELAKLDGNSHKEPSHGADGAGRADVDDEALGSRPDLAPDWTGLAPDLAPDLEASAERIRKLRFRLVSEVGDRVFFAESSAVIGGRARAILEAQARWLKRAPSINITIIGRADDGGSSSDATTLARQRAEIVRAKLIEGGVEVERIKIESHGENDPVATCRSALCQAQNRHAETRLRVPGVDEVSHGSIDTAPETRGAEALGAEGWGADGAETGHAQSNN